MSATSLFQAFLAVDLYKYYVIAKLFDAIPRYNIVPFASEESPIFTRPGNYYSYKATGFCINKYITYKPYPVSGANIDYFLALEIGNSAFQKNPPLCERIHKGRDLFILYSKDHGCKLEINYKTKCVNDCCNKRTGHNRRVKTYFLCHKRK